jgi:hypothetical protein
VLWEVILSKIAKPEWERFRWYIDLERNIWHKHVGVDFFHILWSTTINLSRASFFVEDLEFLFFPVFHEIVKQKKVFGRERNSFIPVEIKALFSLKILGRDEICDTISKLSDLGDSACHTIFKQFITHFVGNF